MPKKKTKKRKKKATSKSNVVKIKVEAVAPKRKARKKTTRKKSTTPKKRKVSAEKVQVELQPVLVENFVALQKVMLNLSQKFENLNVKVASLLELFETSAKTLAKKDFKLGNEANLEGQKEIVDKINNLSEQNKIIAKGLTMLHENQEIHIENEHPMPAANPAPAMPNPVPMNPQAVGQPKTAPAPAAAPKQPGQPPKTNAAPKEAYKKSATFKPLK